MRPDQRVAMVRGITDRMSQMSSGAVVVSSNPKTGKVTYGGARGRQESPVTHPYMGPTSWIRVSPERSTKMIISYRGENLEPYISSYVAEDIEGSSNTSLLEATEAGKFYYRVLKEGEIQITSTGIADISALANGNLELRGGGAFITLDNTNLEIRQEAPVHRRSTLDSPLIGIGDEERFGVVTRPSPADTTTRIMVTSGGKPAKEYIRHLTHESLRVPMIDHREGIVIDDSGVPVLTSGAKTRLRSRYGTTSGQTVDFVIDENGNTSVKIPQCDKGLSVTLMQTDMKFTIGKNFNVTVTQNIGISAGPKVRVDAQLIELAGSTPLITQNWSSAWAAADALLPAATTAEAPAAVTAVVAFLKAVNAQLQPSCTVITKAG